MESCIIEFVKAGRTYPVSIPGVSRSKIADRLLEMLDKTVDGHHLDILCKAVCEEHLNAEILSMC